MVYPSDLPQRASWSTTKDCSSVELDSTFYRFSNLPSGEGMGGRRPRRVTVACTVLLLCVAGGMDIDPAGIESQRDIAVLR